MGVSRKVGLKDWLSLIAMAVSFRAKDIDTFILIRFRIDTLVAPNQK